MDSVQYVHVRFGPKVRRGRTGRSEGDGSSHATEEEGQLDYTRKIMTDVTANHFGAVTRKVVSALSST